MMYGLVNLRFNLRDLEIFVRYHGSQELILRAFLTSDILITARMNLMRDFMSARADNIRDTSILVILLG